MSKDNNTKQRGLSVKKIIGFSFLAIVLVAAFFLYNNFNRLLSDALLRSFDSNIASDVYELKFEKLLVNPFEGSIKVVNVTLQPREEPLNNYPYINSSFRLKAEKLILENVDLFELLRESNLNVETISIIKPDIELILGGNKHILVPFKDSTATISQEGKSKKKPIDSFSLREFQLVDASFHVTNSGKQREFKIDEFNISLHDLLIMQRTGRNLLSFKNADLSVGQFKGILQKGPIQQIGFSDFRIGVDSLDIQMTLDTMIYRFRDFNSGLKALDIQTADSLFHLTLQSFDLSYLNKSINLKAVSLKPNVSHAMLQRDYKFQHAEFSGSVGTFNLNQINFDSLIYAEKLFIDEIVLDSVKISIFKDKTKPIDSARRPRYLSQVIRGMTLPLNIKHLTANHVHLYNTERKPDSTYAKVEITRASLDVKNITNLSDDSGLVVKANAYINDKAHFKAGLTYHYEKTQIDFEGVVEKFSLPSLNSLIQSYTPAKINKGILDEISFTGVAGKAKATGTMKFLYHDLEIDLELREQAKWKSTLIAFAANSVLNSSNPVSNDSPPRIVQFKIERDMTKGFINVLIKSLLNGLKETMIMSKENRKAHHAAKRKSSEK